MLDVSQCQFLVLLFVVQAQHDAPRLLLVTGGRRVSPFPVHVSAELHDLSSDGREKQIRDFFSGISSPREM